MIITLLAPYLNCIGWSLSVSVLTYACIMLLFIFFKRRRIADKYSIFGDADFSIMMGTVACMMFLMDLTGMKEDSGLIPSGAMIVLILTVSIPALIIFTLYKVFGKIRSWIPDDPNED